MPQDKKLSPEEYQKRLNDVLHFLLRLIEISEKIQDDLETHDDEISALYEQRKALFSTADGFLATWIHHCHLSASDSWSLYRNFLLAVEEEHVNKQYKVLNQSLSFNKDARSMINNPFLVQQEDEIDDRDKVDELINKHHITRQEVMEIMSNLSLKEITELMLLAKHLTNGGGWEHKYDL